MLVLRSVALRLCALLLLVASLAFGQAQYSHGDPTDEEQLFLEFINQARASIDDEVIRLTNTTDPDVLDSINFFNVDLNLMASQFETLKSNNGNSQMPLAFNPLLIEASRKHSEDMFISVFQGHESSSNALGDNVAGDKHGARIDNEGYDSFRSAENVFAAADSVWHGHAGFNIDWGNGPGGIQDPAGHRESIHANGRREAGIGVYLGNNEYSNKPNGTIYGNDNSHGENSTFDTVGPILVTQVFAKQNPNTTSFDVPFLTGVSFLDIDGDQFYSLGEGLHGIRIDVDGASYFAETSASGGFAIPLPNQAGTYDLTISGPGITTFTDTITVNGDLDNVKWDYMPSFTLPTPSGSVSPSSGSASSYSFNGLPGASQYRVRVSQLDNYNWETGAKDGQPNFTTELSEGTLEDQTAYTGVQSIVVNSGNNAFYLAHYDSNDQIITFSDEIIPSSSSNLTFQSRLGWSTDAEFATIEISTNGGNSWEEVYNQAGFNPAGNSTLTNPGESSFNQRSVDLSSYANQVIQVRLNYKVAGSRSDNAGQLTNLVGWVIDDLAISNTKIISESVHANFNATEFDFTPPAPGPYMLETTGISGERVFPFGLPLFVDATGSSSGGTLAESLEGFEFYNETDTAVYFAESTDLSGDGHTNWRGFPNFGLVNIEHFPWVFHEKMGYVYMFGPGGDDLYLYIPDLQAFCYTNISSDFFPYIYDFTHGHWWYFSVSTSSVSERHYYSFEPGNAGWQSFSQ